MNVKSILFITGFALSVLIPANALPSPTLEEQITTINSQLETAANPKDTAKLYCYRARNYAKSGKIKEAKSDYFKALNTSYDGWILNELGYFMYKNGDYEKAYNISLKVLGDFPHLEKEAEYLKNQAKKMWDEEYKKKNPPTIIMDSEPDPSRVTRHDLIQQSPQKSGSNTYAPPTAKTKKTKSSSSGGSHIGGYGTNSAFRKNYIESRKNKGQ